MKMKLMLLRSALLPLLLLITHHSSLSTVLGQGTAITYQGRLDESGSPINGSYDLRFGLFSGPAVPLEIAALTNSAVPVSNGLFTITMDFGSNAFAAGTRYFEISVRSNSLGSFNTLSPRQQITPTPYAIRAANFSGTVSASQLTGTVPLAQLPTAVVTNNASSVTLSGTFNGTHNGSFTGNGAGLTNVSGLNPDEFWQLDGNNVTPGKVLGSTNNQTLTFVVNGFTALRLQPNSMALPNLIGGEAGNFIGAGVYAAVIGGGFANQILSNATETVIAGGSFNSIGSGASYASIVAGDNNKIMAGASQAHIGGGEGNVIETNSFYAFIGAGAQNRMLGNNAFSAISGGNANTLGIGSRYAAVGGGINNTNAALTSGAIAGGEGNSIQPLADRSFIGGGLRNITTGALGMVPGGFANSAAAQAFAAGRRAKANHSGAFVWADSTDADFPSTAIDQVSFRCNGGVRFTSGGGGGNQTVAWAPGNAAWAFSSDRNLKESLQPVDPQAVLAKVAQLPMAEWNFKGHPQQRHIGPMAQDFHAAFPLNENDTQIDSGDLHGVTLAAIQGLNQKLEQTLRQKDSEILELKQRLAALEKIIRQPEPN
jgi:trimeric autotransporter adhesin